METWMKIEDLCKYLQVTENWIRSRVRRKAIPFHNNHGILRFNRQEIDDWMKVPPPLSATHSKSGVQDERRQERMESYADQPYRDKPAREYVLTASKIMIGRTAWMRLPFFVEKVVARTKEHDRNYLFREEIKGLLPNSNDYLRVSCQLGLIDIDSNKEQDQRIKHYCPTQYAELISQTRDIVRIREIIGESILHLVRTRKEVHPDEKHAILLLWLFLNFKNSGIRPQEHHFRKATDKPDNSYPLIRLNFAKSLCNFLFVGNSDQERDFFNKWQQCM